MSNVLERLTGEAAIGDDVRLNADDVRESTGLHHAPSAEDAGARRGYHLNEYLTNRAFGGPEEGGWWYDTGTFVACHGVYPTREEARAALDAMQTRLAERRRGLHAPDSVLCSGWPVFHVEPHPGADFPRTWPRYE